MSRPASKYKDEPSGAARYEDISVDYAALYGDERPFLDKDLSPEQTNELSENQRFWRENGYLILPKFMPDNLIEDYVRIRQKCRGGVGGWAGAPYNYYQEVRDFCLYKPLVEIIENLIGDKPLLHLNLTGWVSSERNWHQDDYLNAPNVKGAYLAAWAALDDINPDSGPFEYVPGSHRWPTMSADKIRSLLHPYYANQWGSPGRDDGHWAEHSESLCARAAEDYIERRGVKPVQFLANRGDVLLWHACLLHRGSKPKVPGMLRKTLISHYSGERSRTDFPLEGRRSHSSGGFYQHHDGPLNFDGGPDLD